QHILITAAAGPFDADQLFAEVTTAGRPQLVFQDPFSSLNPAHTVRRIITEVLRLHKTLTDKAQLHQQADELLTAVGLSPTAFGDRLPAALSGGQRQRVAIARSLAAKPELLIADEAVSALDAPLRAEVLALLDRLRGERQLGLLFISHDLRLVADWADRVLIMDEGRIVESGPASEVLRAPASDLGRRLAENLS
ncbi:MAG: dipeptide/oligopeptide/nickel ABC transporter ATP-binding protein, partial [Bacteroidota bacterium]